MQKKTKISSRRNFLSTEMTSNIPVDDVRRNTINKNKKEYITIKGETDTKKYTVSRNNMKKRKN
jgi:hypothetical protein